jgi:hypothetical protein
LISLALSASNFGGGVSVMLPQFPSPVPRLSELLQQPSGRSYKVSPQGRQGQAHQAAPPEHTRPSKPVRMPPIRVRLPISLRICGNSEAYARLFVSHSASRHPRLGGTHATSHHQPAALLPGLLYSASISGGLLIPSAVWVHADDQGHTLAAASRACTTLAE